MAPADSVPAFPVPSRLPTRVPGLDVVLDGGLMVGDTYLVAGMPGTGKTTFGNQIAFAHAAGGGTVLFATLLTESHDRMLTHMQGFSFFDPSVVGDRIHYISLMGPMQAGDIEETLRLVIEMLRHYGASLLILDGAGAVRMFADSELDYLRFLHGLDARAATLGCTTVLLASEREAEAAATHVDGVIEFSNVTTLTTSARDARWLRVAKLRGSDYLNGHHRFAIGEDGLTIFPRLEAAQAELTPTWHGQDDRLLFGIPGLDAMLDGGLHHASSTLILGTPGVGKTLLGLHFLAEGARRDERCLIAGFHETPPALAATADGAGLGLGSHLDSGLVHAMWRPPLELSPDEWAWNLLDAIDQHEPRRLVIDAFSDLLPLFAIPERRVFFVPALVNRLRDHGVTTLVLMEIDAFTGPALSVPVNNMSATMDSAILLRSVEVRSSLRRMVSILKQRQTAFDPTIREFSIGADGIVVGDPFDASMLLTGLSGPMTETG